MIPLPAWALALAPLALPQQAADGFDSEVAPYPSSATIRELSDGSFVTCNGIDIRRHAADGSSLGVIGSFTSSGSTGAMVIDPTESFVLVGEKNSGEMLRVDLGGGGQTTLATLLDNEDAVFESPSQAIVSARICGGGCGNAILRLDVNTGDVTPIAHVDGNAGPVALRANGDLAYGTVSPPQIQPGAGEIIQLTAGQLSSPPVASHQAYDNLVVIEVESTPPAGNWNEYTTFSGFTGDSYYRWDGPDLFGSPGSGIMRFEFEVQETGNYKMRIRNRHEDPAPDQDNDCWVRVDGGQWLKCFSNEGFSTIGVWNWHSVIEEDNGTKYDANYDLTAGKHVLEVSGRSNGYMIDRFVFFPLTVFNWQDTNNPESLKAPYNQTYFSTHATGLSGSSEMVSDPETDALFVAENIEWTGLNSIQRVDPSGLLFEVVSGAPFQKIRNLEFLPENGIGAFLPYQPEGNGQLAFSRLEAGVVNERRYVEPLRATCSVSGPGVATGTGDVTLAIEDATGGGTAFIAFAPTGTLLPSEYTVAYYGLPLVHTAFDAPNTMLIPTPLPLDASGDFSLTYFHNVGIPGAVAIQAVFLAPDFTVAGSTTTAIL